MATTRREGLRLPKLPKPPKFTKTNAERCRDVRSAVKADPELYAAKLLSEAARSKANRLKVKLLGVGEEEKRHQRELARIRQQRRRERIRAEQLCTDVPTPPQQKTSTPPQQKTRASSQAYNSAECARREKWAAEKRKERSNWSSQKRRRAREQSLAYYYQKKEAAATIQVQADGDSLERNAISLERDTVSLERNIVNLERNAISLERDTVKVITKEGERKALYRAKKAVLRVRPSLFGKLYTSITKSALKSPRKKNSVQKTHNISPSAKKVKQNVNAKLADLKGKRSKKSLAARRLLLDTVNGTDSSNKTSQGTYVRKKRSEAAVAVVAFLEDVSIHLPGKRSVSKKTGQPKKVLPKRTKRLHADFKKKHPHLKVSRATFYRLIPDHILTATKQRLRQCLCEICANVDLKLDTFNKYMKKDSILDGRDALSEASLCSVPMLQCYDRICTDCGVDKVRVMLQNGLSTSASSVVKWGSWEMVKDGKHQRVQLVQKEGTLEELATLIISSLQLFSRHLFVFRWQHMQFKNAIFAVTPRPNLAVAVVDFAENYHCFFQDEVSTAHWNPKQLTLHPTVTYFKCPNGNCPETVTDYLVFVSDDTVHDASMAKAILEKTQEHLEAVMPSLDKIIVFSDGCAAQYKSKLPLFHTANATGPVSVERAYFGSRHGKSPCDACGGVIKRLMEEDVLAGEVQIQTAADICAHGAKYYCIPQQQPPPDTCCHKRRCFVEVLEEQVDRSMTSKSLLTLPGTRSLHSVRGLGSDVLQTRKLSCFCSACLDNNTADCVNIDIVSGWDTVKIKRSRHVPNEEEQPNVPIPPPSAATKETAPPSAATKETAPPSAATKETAPPSAATKETAPPSAATKETAPPSAATKETAPPSAATKETAPPSAATKETAPPSAVTKETAPPSAATKETAPPSAATKETAPPSAAAKEQESRKKVFKQLHTRLQSAVTFIDLLAVALDIQSTVAGYPIRVQGDLRAETFQKDKTAALLYPCDGPANLHPTTIYGDGNCLPRCGSVLAFGCEDHHTEMRVRITVDMVINKHKYVSPSLSTVVRDLPRKGVEYSDEYAQEVLTEGVIEEKFNKIVLGAVESGKYMGILQVYAMSKVLNVPLNLIYPAGVGHHVRSDLMHTVLPYAGGAANAGEPQYGIMWTHTLGWDVPSINWSPNHFVVCLPSSSLRSRLVSGDIVLVELPSPNKHGAGERFPAQITSEDLEQKGAWGVYLKKSTRNGWILPAEDDEPNFLPLKEIVRVLEYNISQQGRSLICTFADM